MVKFHFLKSMLQRHPVSHTEQKHRSLNCTDCVWPAGGSIVYSDAWFASHTIGHNNDLSPSSTRLAEVRQSKIILMIRRLQNLSHLDSLYYVRIEFNMTSQCILFQTHNVSFPAELTWNYFIVNFTLYASHGQVITLGIVPRLRDRAILFLWVFTDIISYSIINRLQQHCWNT